MLISFPTTFINSSPKRILLLDASNAGSITSSVGAVSQWNDLSGNGNHFTQATAAQKPLTGIDTINSLNALKFTAIQLLASSSGMTLGNAPATIFIVWKGTNGAAQQFCIGSSSASFSIRRTTTSTQFSSVCGGTEVLSGGPSDTLVHCQMLRRNKTSLDCCVDGVLGNNALATDQVLTSLTVGRNGSGIVGDVGEVSAYNAALTNAQANTEAQRLASKWGFTWTNL